MKGRAPVELTENKLVLKIVTRVVIGLVVTFALIAGCEVINKKQETRERIACTAAGLEWNNFRCSDNVDDD